MTTTESRRDRLRRELTAEIVEIGRRQLDEGGVAGVSWRGIAKEVGMNPASLYTYVDGVDDLYTRILLASFEGLALAVREAADAERDADPIERTMACSAAYRRWAIDNPRQFNLIFTDQIPGYAAPEGGPTVAAETAVYRPFLEAVAELTGIAADPEHFEQLPADQRIDILEPMTSLHGFVMLEINHHVPMAGDPPAFFDRLRQRVEELAERYGASTG